MDTPAAAPLSRRVWFWVLLAAASLACAALSYRLFPRVFPVVSLDLRMDRSHAIGAARSLAAGAHWGPAGPVRDVATFGDDSAAQAFIELEGGGKTAFAALLHDDLFSPYAWHVRLFKEADAHQAVVSFKPDGAPYGFVETLRENAPGAALTAAQARPIAEAAVRAAPWNLPLDRFKLVESSQVTRPGGRIDHTFVYERPDRQLGEGRLRLRLVVSGDRLTTVANFVHVPEAFTRRYSEMRSANTAIASGASVAMVLLYLVGGGGIGVFFLLRRRAVLWRAPLAWAGVITGLELLAMLNSWPLVWLHYDTAVSAGNFAATQVATMIAAALGLGFVIFLSFLAAEGLTRLAFPQHPQLWRIWSADAAPTRAVLGRTFGGYLLAGVMLLYVVAFYYVAFRFGWWSPSEALVDPNLLAHYQPWLTPLATAARAGSWEESLFRAVPLAGAALLGTRFGGRRWWIAGAFVLQAVVFAAAHANYPNQPAYSRMVELLVPASVFAGLYLVYGLLPAMLMHFTFDVVLMSLPLFVASGAGATADRVLVVLAALVPLWIVLWRRARRGRWGELPESLRNSAWQPPEPAPPAGPSPEFAVPPSEPSRLVTWAIVLGVAGLAAWIFAAPARHFGSPLKNTRAQAITSARAELTRRSITLPATFRADASVASGPDEANRFVWRTVGRDRFASFLGTYLPDSHWNVRFATFQGDVASRAEQWVVGVAGDGRIVQVEHSLPEARAGASLTETEARGRVHAILQEETRLDPAALREVSAKSEKRPHRTDWTFVYRDPSIQSLGAGEARIEVQLAGDQRANLLRFVFVPEEWQRADRALAAKFRIGAMTKGLLLGVLVIAGIVIAIVGWSRKQFQLRLALIVFALAVFSTVSGFVLGWPSAVAHFSTAQPLAVQETMLIIGVCVAALIGSGAVALLPGWGARAVRREGRSTARSWMLGAGAAFAVLGGLALVSHLRGNPAPDWLQLGPAGTYIPWLAPVCGAPGQWASQTAMLLFIAALLDQLSSGWRRRRLLVVPLGILIAVASTLPPNGTSVAGWLAAGAGAVVVVGGVYFLLLRHDLTALPAAVAVGGAVGALQAAMPAGYPGALAGAAFAAAVWIVSGFFGVRVFRSLAAAAGSPEGVRPPAPPAVATE